RKSLKHRPLRIEELLRPQSAIKAPIDRSGRRSTTVAINSDAPGGKTRLVSRHVKKKIEWIAERKKRAANNKKKVEEERDMDIWGEKSAGKDGFISVEENLNEYLEPVRPRQVKKPKLPNEIPDIPAVKIADPGASYNPAFEDHQELLGKALEVELKKESEKEKLTKQLSYPPELDDLDDEPYFDSDDEEEEDAEASSNENATEKPSAASGKRKTKADRKKEEKRQKQALVEEKKKQEKMFNSQLDRIPEISSMVEEELAKEKPEDSEAKKDFKKKRIGPVPFKAKPLEIKLTEELTQGLRMLKPEGNILQDRFTSLQERSIIEPRVPKSRKTRYKRKETENHDYKRFDAETFSKFKK
ncbi:Glioma tumor suppressor candidate region protein 2, partial [Dinochytrium kinnereticum]